MLIHCGNATGTIKLLIFGRAFFLSFRFRNKSSILYHVFSHQFYGVMLAKWLSWQIGMDKKPYNTANSWPILGQAKDHLY